MPSRRKRVAPAHEVAALPKVSPIVADAVMDMLMEDQGMLRPPEKAAAILALLVEMHKQGMPFPGRQVVADAVRCSIYTVDAVISTRLAEGYISQAVETVDGNVQQRHGVIRQRYYVPSKELQEVVAGAERRRRPQ